MEEGFDLVFRITYLIKREDIFMNNVINELNLLKKELYDVAKELQNQLPAHNLAFFKELVDNSEIGLGVETLLEQIEDYDIAITNRCYQILKKAASDILDDSYFNSIKILPNNDEAL